MIDGPEEFTASVPVDAIFTEGDAEFADRCVVAQQSKVLQDGHICGGAGVTSATQRATELEQRVHRLQQELACAREAVLVDTKAARQGGVFGVYGVAHVRTEARQSGEGVECPTPRPSEYPYASSRIPRKRRGGDSPR